MNDAQITNDIEHHYLKSWFANFTEKTREEMANEHAACNFAEDGSKLMNFNSEAVMGRMSFMCNTAWKNYRKDTIRLVGYLYHDLRNLSSGIPPGIRVEFRLWRNKAERIIDQPTHLHRKI